MNPESDSFARCVRHPSQFFTGFCSSCLVERLSNVGSAESSDKRSAATQNEIVEVSVAAPINDNKPDNTRMRKTLLSLFQQDDVDGLVNEDQAINNQLGLENRATHNDRSSGDGYECGTGASSGVKCSENDELQTKSHLETKISGGNANATGANSSCAHVGRKFDPLEDSKLKDRGTTFWLSSMLPKKGLRWKIMNGSRKNQGPDRSINGSGDQQLESKPNFRHSCDWRVCHDSSKANWELPRHSWDGSMVSKALSCSFACLEEQEDGSSRIKRRLPEATLSAEPNPIAECFDTSNVDVVHLADGKPLSSEDTVGSHSGEMGHEEFQQQISVAGIRRRKSHRWSKVWDWSITSPFRDFAKKREHVLERSLSESWQDGRRHKSMESVEYDGRGQFNGNGLGSARSQLCGNRSINSVNGDLQNFRPDWQKTRDCKLGRSRSVHYSSPGNLDNGLLRFYLTPLRSSRRNVKRSRRKSSRSFSRGIFGLY